MNTTDLEPLKGLTLPIVAPKKIPTSLKIDKIVALPDPNAGDGYEIEWRSDTAELKLRASSKEIQNQVQGKEQIEFETPYFGELVLARSGEELVSQWFSEMQSGLPAYSVSARGLQPDDVIEFVRSLDYVRVN